MKYILFLLLFVSINASAQKDSCKAGQVYIDNFYQSTGMIIEPGCYDSAVAKKIIKEWWKNLCGETGFMTMSDKYLFDNNQRWNDSTGCISRPIYKKKIKGKWVAISKEQYDKESGVIYGEIKITRW